MHHATGLISFPGRAVCSELFGTNRVALVPKSAKSTLCCHSEFHAQCDYEHDHQVAVDSEPKMGPKIFASESTDR